MELTNGIYCHEVESSMEASQKWNPVSRYNTNTVIPLNFKRNT